MSVTIVQQTAASTSAASVVVPLTTAVQSGDTLIASVCMVGGASVASITDTLGGRWIQTARSYQSDAGTELWTARGHAPIVTDNLVGDSNLTYAIGAVGPTWVPNSASIGTANGDWNVLDGGSDSAEWVYYGTGSTAPEQFMCSMTIDVVPGATYTLSAQLDGANLLAGDVMGIGVWIGTTGDFSQSIVALRQTAGTSGVVSGEFTIPSGVTQVFVTPALSWNTIGAGGATSGATISWSQIQLTETSTVQPYEPGPLLPVTVNFTTAVAAGVNVLEASGLWYASPLDQWTQYNSSVASAGVTPPATNTTPTLSAPSAPTVTVEGTTGSTTYNYEVTVANQFGQSTPSTVASTSSGNATLSATDYNLVSWPAVPLPAGSAGNLVYDSNLENAIAAVGPTWNTSGVPIGTANGDFTVLNAGQLGAEWVCYGTGAAQTGEISSEPFELVIGTTYMLSCLIDATAATAGAVTLGTGGNGFTGIGAGSSGLVTLTIVAQTTSDSVNVNINGATVTAGDTVTWSQIQLTETSTVEPYAPGPLWTYPVYRETGGTYGLIGTTTALAFEDTGTAIVIPRTVVPRGNNELVVAACSTNASVGVPDGSYTALSMTGGTNFAAAYNVLTTNLSPMLTWPTDAASSWATVQAAFLPGASGLNPDLQFPETSVQICTQTNWQAPFSGAGIWTELAPYVQGFTAGPIGRQHELDRVQAAPANITLDNRTGVFNPWNTESFIYDNGSGMKPMNPIKITAAWNGITYPVYYGYFQSLTNTIKDVLNVEATLACIDILQILSLKYLASDNYAQLVQSDGGTNLEAYYRLGDAPGSYSVQDSSGYGRTGSLINGLSGEPLWGQAGVYLYDPTTALDLTNGANVANGGFTTTDNTTQPPTVYEPLGSAADWSFECWAKMVGSVAGVGTGVDFSASVNAGSDTVYTPAVLPIGSVTYIYNNDFTYVFPMGTFVASVGPFQSGPGWYPYVLTQDALATGQMQGISYPGGAGAALFSASATGGDISIRVGPYLMGPNPVNGYLMIGVAGNGPTLPLTQLGAYAYIGNTLDGNWHHICVQVSPEPSPTGVTRIFIDGVLVSSQPNPATTTFADPTGITVGCDGDPHNGLPAWLQDVALYSEFLTGAQVQRHYEVGKWFQAIELGAANGAAHEARLNKVLAVSGLDPSTMLAVPNNVPFKTYLYAETNPVTTTSGLNYMQTTSETEPALIFQGPTGIISAYGRQYQYLADNAVTSQGIFGDNVSTATYHYEGTTLTMTQDDLDVFNDIQVQSGRGGYQAGTVYVPPGGIQGTTSGANAGGGQLEEWGPSQSALMAQSASTYGDRTLQGLTSLQFEYDSDALAVAQNYGVWYRDPIMRIETMTLNSYSDNGVNIPQILGRGLYDRITVQYQGQVAGPQFSQESLIESISHSVTISSGPVWASTWALSPYEILMAPTILGTFTFGGTSANGVLTL